MRHFNADGGAGRILLPYCFHAFCVEWFHCGSCCSSPTSLLMIKASQRDLGRGWRWLYAPHTSDRCWIMLFCTVVLYCGIGLWSQRANEIKETKLIIDKQVIMCDYASVNQQEIYELDCGLCCHWFYHGEIQWVTVLACFLLIAERTGCVLMTCHVFPVTTFSQKYFETLLSQNCKRWSFKMHVFRSVDGIILFILFLCSLLPFVCIMFLFCLRMWENTGLLLMPSLAYYWWHASVFIVKLKL